MEDTGFKPDFVLLCETWLTDINCGLFKLNGYNLVEKHSVQSRGGGVCIYVRRGIRYSRREDLSLFQEGCFESIFIETHSGALIGEVYRVPGTGTRPFLDK